MTDTQLPPAWMRPRTPQAAAAQLEAIIAGVAAAYGVRVRDIKGRSRERQIVWPRHVAIALGKRLTGLTNRELGLHFDRDHTGASHSIVTVRSACETYPELARELEALETKLRKNGELCRAEGRGDVNA